MSPLATTKSIENHRQSPKTIENDKDDEQDDALEPEELCEGVYGQVGDEKEALDGEHGLVAGQGQLHPLCKIPCQNSALNKETVARIKTHTQKDDLDSIPDILFTCTEKGL